MLATPALNNRLRPLRNKLSQQESLIPHGMGLFCSRRSIRPLLIHGDSPCQFMNRWSFPSKKEASRNHLKPCLRSSRSSGNPEVLVELPNHPLKESTLVSRCCLTWSGALNMPGHQMTEVRRKSYPPTVRKTLFTAATGSYSVPVATLSSPSQPWKPSHCSHPRSFTRTFKFSLSPAGKSLPLASDQFSTGSLLPATPAEVQGNASRRKLRCTKSPSTASFAAWSRKSTTNSFAKSATTSLIPCAKAKPQRRMLNPLLTRKH